MLNPMEVYLAKQAAKEADDQRFNEPEKPAIKMRLSYEEKYYQKIDKLPKLHPQHPYEVYLNKRGQAQEVVYVSASSNARACIAGVYHYNSCKRKKIKFDQVSARPMMPIEKNMYWDKYDWLANPLTLMLEDYKSN